MASWLGTGAVPGSMNANRTTQRLQALPLPCWHDPRQALPGEAGVSVPRTVLAATLKRRSRKSCCSAEALAPCKTLTFLLVLLV